MNAIPIYGLGLKEWELNFSCTTKMRHAC